MMTCLCPDTELMFMEKDHAQLVFQPPTYSSSQGQSWCSWLRRHTQLLLEKEREACCSYQVKVLCSAAARNSLWWGSQPGCSGQTVLPWLSVHKCASESLRTEKGQRRSLASPQHHPQRLKEKQQQNWIMLVDSSIWIQKTLQTCWRWLSILAHWTEGEFLDQSFSQFNISCDEQGDRHK